MRQIGLLIAVAGLLVFGCGGSEDDATARATPTATPSASPEATATATATAVPSGAAPEAAAARPGLRLQRVGTFRNPVHVAAPRGDRRRVFVVEQGGRIMVMRDGRKLSRPFLDLRRSVSSGGERGLLSMAFAPDYERSRRFYVYYTGRDGGVRIVEFRRRTRERANRGSARLVLSVGQPEPNHNGGLVAFGPDGLLYAGLGDGGGAGDRHGALGNGQNLGTLLGKIIRIDPRKRGSRRYRVPRSNPFVGRRGARGEIYAYGVRNPWRFAWNPSGRLIVADVGQNEVEEVTVVRRGGANLGWRVWEGRRRFMGGETAPGHVPPAVQRLHSAGNCSITGGVVVRDRALSSLRGRYVFGDLCRGRLESVRFSRGRARAARVHSVSVPSLASFGEDGRRRVYAASLGGPVFRLVPR